MNYRSSFAEFMTANGLGCKGLPIDDGAIHRFHVSGDKSGTLNGWYVLRGGRKPSGSFGSWKTGITLSWNAEDAIDLTPRARADLEDQEVELKHQREQERSRLMTVTAKKARILWGDSARATCQHPYIQRKQIQALGLKVTADIILVPLQRVDGQIVNLQRIWADGTKRFLKGGRIKGCFWLAGAAKLPNQGCLYICEGMATAATIHQATGIPVAAAMNAGNLQNVAEQIRKARPDLDLIIAADNDHRTPGNPGLTKAEAVSKALKIPITIPELPCNEPCQCSDFNDLANCGGLKHG